MSTLPDPADGRAIEYALGTLPIAERDAFASDMANNPALAAEVRDWEARLAALAEGVTPVDPSPRLWGRISRAIGAGSVADASAAVPNVIPFELARLRRSRTIWRSVAAGAAAMAACLAVVLASDRLAPPSARMGLVAVVNRSGEMPALIVRVDAAAGTVQVRSLAAETPNGRSLELWSIVGGDAPHSLGTLGIGATRIPVASADRRRLDGATLAVSVEPPGGSPTGGPTGPVVYSGKLVSERE